MLSRQEQKKQLLARTRDAVKRKDVSQFASLYKNPSEVPQWKCAEGKHKVDIIPFISTGKVPAGRPGDVIPEGELAYLFECWVHFNVGANDDAFICLSKTYGDPCPICEDRKRLIQEGEVEEDVIKGLQAKQRTIYNIICYDTREEEKKGIQVWDVAYFFVERNLRSIAEQSEGGDPIIFADLEEGKQIKFQRKGSGAGNTSFLGHAFVERDYELSAKLLDKAFKLDEIILIPSYEEVANCYFGKRGKVAEEEEEEEAPVRTKKRPRGEEEEEEEVPARTLKKKTTKQECPVGGVFGKDFDSYEECADCSAFDACADEYDSEKPAKKSKKEPDDVPDEVADEDEVRIPKKKLQRRSRD